MSDFNWSDTQLLPFPQRYSRFPPRELLGLSEWERGMQQFSFQQAEGWQWIQRLRAIRALPRPAPACPRVFVSHRQADDVPARRIARLANGEDFQFWLDIIDLPPRLPSPPPNAINRAVLIAAIIEMALINCTHVIAAITDNSKGSLWIPYEYGRVQDDPPADRIASCWVDTTTVPVTDIAEYLHLGPVLRNEADVSRWLQAERANYPGSGCAGRWVHGITQSLPTG